MLADDLVYQKIAPEAIADKIKKSLASSGLEAP
jgi:hypothetical protein